MPKKLILIDLDDTLWDTWANNQESLRELYTALDWGRYFISFEHFFERYYYPINHELWSLYNEERITKDELCLARLYRPLAKRYDECVGEGSIEHPLGETELEGLRGLLRGEATYWACANEQFMTLIRSKQRLCPGAKELLRYLHSKYTVCIVSNGFPEVQYDKLEHSGLSPYVGAVVLSDEVGYNKPNPKIFACALQRMACSAEEAVMIGDSWVSDVEGASRAGIESIWYNRYDLTAPEGSGAKPLYTVRHLEEISTLL